MRFTSNYQRHALRVSQLFELAWAVDPRRNDGVPIAEEQI